MIISEDRSVSCFDVSLWYKVKPILKIVISGILILLSCPVLIYSYIAYVQWCLNKILG